MVCQAGKRRSKNQHDIKKRKTIIKKPDNSENGATRGHEPL